MMVCKVEWHNGIPKYEGRETTRIPGSEVTMDTNESEFSQEDVLPIVKTAIEAALKDTVYNRKKNLNKPFKYAVTCLIMQKTGAGMTTAAACFWDPTMDGYCTVLWENSTIYCIVTVYGAAISPSATKLDH